MVFSKVPQGFRSSWGRELFQTESSYNYKISNTSFHYFIILACLTLVTFDDIPGQSSVSGVIPNGYQGLNWTNAEYINVSTTSLSGYQNGVQTPPYVVHNPTGGSWSVTTANATSFAFNSVRLVSAWRDALTHSTRWVPPVGPTIVWQENQKKNTFFFFSRRLQ